MGLRTGLALCYGLRRSLTGDEQHKVADAIVTHLETNKLEDRTRAATWRAWHQHHAGEVVMSPPWITVRRLIGAAVGGGEPIESDRRRRCLRRYS
jgi:hypothetical protein